MMMPKAPTRDAKKPPTKAMVDATALELASVPVKSKRPARHRIPVKMAKITKLPAMMPMAILRFIADSPGMRPRSGVIIQQRLKDDNLRGRRIADGTFGRLGLISKGRFFPA